MSADASLAGMAPVLGAISVCAAVAAIVFLRTTTRTLKCVTLIASALLVVATATLLIDPSGGLVALGGRSAMLLAFLLSPALAARHA